MRKKIFKFISLFMILTLILSSCGLENFEENQTFLGEEILQDDVDLMDDLDYPEEDGEKTKVKESNESDNLEEIDEDIISNSKEEVALYIKLYNKLPKNYISKKQARELGWKSEKGNLWDVAYGMSIGGDKFGNREGLLPKKNGRQYYECDINYEGGFRGPERLVYSNDGLIYWTGDHYKSFELVYGED